MFNYSGFFLFQAVNELLESLAAPLEIVEGFVQSIKVTIPWAALVTDHCTLEITGLQITCRPKDRTSKLTTPSQPGWYVPGTGSVLIIHLCFMTHLCRWPLGLPRLVLMYDLQHAAGPGVSKGPTWGIRRTACSFGGAGNVRTNHWDRYVLSKCY